MQGFQQRTRSTDGCFIIFPAGGRVAVYLLIARGANFDSLLHGERSIVLSLLTVKAQIGKRLCVEALAFLRRVSSFADRVVDRHVNIGGLSGLALGFAWPV
jgi:hypothetical protein